MITLDEIKKHEPDDDMWEILVNTYSKNKDSFYKPFPLSFMLDSNGLKDTLWCFRLIPENYDISVKFLLFCIKNIRKNSDDKQMHYFINAIDKYLSKSITLRELREIVDIFRDVVRSNEARAAACTAFYIANPSYNNNLYTAAQAVMLAVAQKAARSSTKNSIYTHRNVYKTEEQRQINYLRKLLDGKE